MKCKTFLVVSDDGTVFKAEDSHNYQSNPGDAQARQLRGNMRKRARDETTSVQVIYDQEKVKLFQHKKVIIYTYFGVEIETNAMFQPDYCRPCSCTDDLCCG